VVEGGDAKPRSRGVGADFDDIAHADQLREVILAVDLRMAVSDRTHADDTHTQHQSSTTFPLSHDSIAPSMTRWALSASSALASTRSKGVLFLMSLTHARMRLSKVSLKLRMLPRYLYVSLSIFPRGWNSSTSQASVMTMRASCPTIS